MPKYYCDYCDIFLTHDSPSVRKSHNEGWKHKLAVRTYYSQFEEDHTQSLIDQKIKEFEGKVAQTGYPGGAIPISALPSPYPGYTMGYPYFPFRLAPPVSVGGTPTSTPTMVPVSGLPAPQTGNPSSAGAMPSPSAPHGAGVALNGAAKYPPQYYSAYDPSSVAPTTPPNEVSKRPRESFDSETGDDETTISEKRIKTEGDK